MNDPGTQIGAYTVEGEIGRGGMGVVYKATDSRLGRTVAIKSLPEHFAADPQRLSRFEREARTLAALSHPNVAGIYNVEEHDGRWFLILEYVEGESLAQRLDRGPLSVHDALEFCAQIASGVEAAHEAGVVHRDLKPANITITSEGNAKVLDFGLARSDEQTSSGSSMSQLPTLTTPAGPTSPTVPGAVLGTAPYMSPEQARGRKIDKRSDIWSLGVVLYECLTGVSPFAGETATDSIGAILHKDVDFDLLPESTPRRVHELLHRMLQRDKALRMRDAGDVWIELEAARTDLASGTALGAGADDGRRLRRVVLAGAIGVAIVALAFGTWALLQQPESSGGLGAPRFARVTDGPLLEGNPTVSPDGETVVYTAGPTGKRDLYRMRIGGINATNLTADADNDYSGPAFSPDGRQIAFSSDQDGGGIWVMGATGESPRRVTRFGLDPEWSPDGRRLVFSTEHAENPFARSGIGALWVVSLDGGEPVQIFAGDAVEPSWSPDGNRIAFWGLVGESGQRDIFTIPAGGGDAIKVTDDAPTDWSPNWSSDGQFIYFCSDRSGTANVWRVRIKASTGEPSGRIEPVTAGADGGVFGLSLARRASVAAFWSYSHNQSNIERLPIDLSSEAPPATAGEPVLESAFFTALPSLAPDGERFVAWIVRDAENLLVANVDGSNRRLITNDAAKDRVPTWSPDGEWIAFLTDRSGKYEVWIIRPDGSDAQKISDTSLRMGSVAYWGPGPNELSLRGASGEVVTSLGPDGTPGETRPFDLPTSDIGRIAPTEWSPDGSMLLCVIDSESGKGAAVFDVASQEIIWQSEEYSPGTWLDDGRVFVMSEKTIEILDLQSREVRAVLRSDKPFWALGARNRFMSYDAGASVLYFSRFMTNTDIWVADFSYD